MNNEGLHKISQQSFIMKNIHLIKKLEIFNENVNGLKNA